MRRHAIALAVLTLLGVAHAGESELDARFAAAVALEGKGELMEAATALRTLADESPTSSVAPDAFAEACGLYDQRLFRSSDALACWRDLLARYPQSRSAARALNRVRALSPLLAQLAPTDREALAQFDAIVAGTPEPASRGGLRALLAAHPQLPVAAHAHAWLAQAAARARDFDEALREDEAAITTPPDAWSARALRDECELLVRLGRYGDAARVVDRLARVDDDVSREAVLELRHTLTVAHRMAWVARLAWVWLGLYAVLAFAALPKLWPLPREVRFIAPAVLLFVLGAVLEAKTVVTAIAEIGAAGIAITWLAASARRFRFVLSLVAGLSVLVVAYLVVRGNDLTALVIETMRSGPER